jgi:hypothetical protein
MHLSLRGVPLPTKRSVLQRAGEGGLGGGVVLMRLQTDPGAAEQNSDGSQVLPSHGAGSQEASAGVQDSKTWSLG